MRFISGFHRADGARASQGRAATVRWRRHLTDCVSTWCPGWGSAVAGCSETGSFTPWDSAQKAAMYLEPSSTLHWDLANVFPEHAGPAHRCGSSPQVWVRPGPACRDCVPSRGTYVRSAQLIDNLRSSYSLGILTGVKVLVNYTRWFFLRLIINISLYN